MNIKPIQNPQLTIRRATTDDSALLARLGTETYRDTFEADNSPENMQAYLNSAFSEQIQARELSEPGSIFLIAQMQDTPVGYARLTPGVPPTKEGKRPVKIQRLYAASNRIGQGIGAGLMKSCLEIAQHHGHDLIWLGVWENNHRAIAFYTKWGFEIIGNQEFIMGDDHQNDLVMARSVNPIT